MNRFTLLLFAALLVLLAASPSLAKESKKPSPTATDPDDERYDPYTFNGQPGNSGSNNGVQNITNGIDAQFDGVLIVKSKQTSCEVVLASDSYGFIAANCLMVKDKLVASMKEIQIAVHGPKLSALYPVTNVTIHPNYDSDSLANNIAIVKYDSGSKSGIKGKMAAGTSKWKKLGYLRRTLSDVPKTIWNEPTYLVTGQDEDASCSLGSPVFSANRKDFICSNSTTKVPDSGSCSLPYGLVYGVVKSNKVAPAAIFSHTVVFGSGLCSNFKKLNYYVQLNSYLSWGAKVAGYKVKVVDDDSNVSEKKKPSSNNSTFSMKQEGSSVPGVAVYGGNLFTLVDKPKPSPPPTGSAKPPKPTDSEKKPKPTKGSLITVTATRTVYVTRSSANTSDKSTTLDPNPQPTNPQPTNPSGKPTYTIPNIVFVTKLPLPVDKPGNGVSTPKQTATNTTDTETDATSNTDGDSDPENSSSDTKPPTDNESLKATEGMSSKTKILIGVFVGISVLGIGAFCLYYFYYRRR
ncbi:hypothetical protein GGF44_000248 [Coemansia sp. RSA 1694]|nr:hypothetical protein IWW47_002240 [Coemansia sp. RSA 2052]KAJ2581929.1 hypothetical protein GGH95_001817 [Coemansia sp. RSA 1836]KAJ2644969.1 hypothetical protein GGF44_000248 [Coemansia sp. RSA 1694]